MAGLGDDRGLAGGSAGPEAADLIREARHARKREQLAQLLKDIGGTHTLEDLVALIEDGSFQSFVEKESWAVTQNHVFPQATVLEVFLVVGDAEDIPALAAQVEAYAKAQGCTLMRTIGRYGFRRLGRAQGWKAVAEVWIKEL